MANLTHRIVKTPNPSVWSLAVTAKSSILATDPDFTPVEGTPYKNFPKWFIDSSYMKRWGDYTYVGSEDGRAPDEVILVFARPTTPAEAATAFRTTTYFGNHRWPPVLVAIAFPPVQGANSSYNGRIGGKSALLLGKQYIERRIVIPETNEGTLFIKEEFFSNVPFTIPQYDTPVATEVSWDIPGGPRGAIQECLHADIRIPNTQTISAGVVQGDLASASSITKGQFFPATNFEDWSEYVLSHQQDYQNGYYAVKVTVRPPAPPDPQTI